MDMDSYEDTGLRFAIGLVNRLVPGFEGGREARCAEPFDALRDLLTVDAASLDALRRPHVQAFEDLAARLHTIFRHLDRGDVAEAAALLNRILDAHPANPHLALEDGVWRMHHHPAQSELGSMWSSICAEAIARMIGRQWAHRFGICAAEGCDRAFFDTSRNGSRRFCSTACQNRTKTAAFRARNAGREA